ncbi:hypothetical protein MKZ26_21580 [Sporosarcina sp. FSL K6-6792]|uniref:hypothetical protein n=1 Tax=Sporosarcina sp. FSL K6-6792 TaxID=2921559 RepID=UPI0030FB639E
MEKFIKTKSGTGILLPVPLLVTSRLRAPRGSVISWSGYVAKNATSSARLMTAAGPQDVGHVAVATGSGALKLHSFVTGASAFGYV